MKTDKLTDLVKEYKLNNTEELLPLIDKLSRRLIYQQFKFYCVNYFPPVIREDIEDDCRTLILLRTISQFDPSRKVKFSTFYTWKLKSHIRSRKEFYLRRKKLVESKSLDMDLYEGKESLKLKDVLTNFNYSTLHNTRMRMKEIFK